MQLCTTVERGLNRRGKNRAHKGKSWKTDFFVWLLGCCSSMEFYCKQLTTSSAWTYIMSPETRWLSSPTTVDDLLPLHVGEIAGLCRTVFEGYPIDTRIYHSLSFTIYHKSPTVDTGIWNLSEMTRMEWPNQCTPIIIPLSASFNSRRSLMLTTSVRIAPSRSLALVSLPHDTYWWRENEITCCSGGVRWLMAR